MSTLLTTWGARGATTQPVFRDRQPVEVWDGARWRSTVVDAPDNSELWSGDCGWICVAGWAGRAGPVSVRIENVRGPS